MSLKRTRRRRRVTTKKIVIGLATALVTVLLAFGVAWLVVSDTTLLALIGKRLESASGTRISYQSPARITRTLWPELTVTNLIIVDNDKRYQFRTSSLKVQIRLLKLLLGQLDISHLWLGETRVEFARRTPSESVTSGTEGFSLPITPVLHDLRISRLSFERDGEEFRLPSINIDELTMKPDADTDTLAVSSRVKVAGNQFDLNATLAGLHKTLTTQRLPVSISVEDEATNLTMEGLIDLSQSPPAVEAAVKGRVSDLKRFAAGTTDVEIPGEVVVSARLTGTMKQLAIENLSASWRGPGQSTAELSGRIANIIALAGFELALNSRLNKPYWLSPQLPKNMGKLESAELSARLSGDYQQLAVRAFSLKASDTNRLNIALAGQFNVARGLNGPEPKDMDLALTVTAPTTRAARVVLFENIPELGALTGSAALRAAKGSPALEDVAVRTRDGEGIEVDVKGRIARLPLYGAGPIEGFDFAVTMKAAATSLIGKRIGLSVPLTGPLDLNFRIEGETQALRLNQIALSAGRDDAMRVRVTGRMAFGPWDRADPLQSIDLKLRADSADTESLGKVIGRELPELGALSARGRLHTVSGNHRLDGLRIHTVRAAPLQVSLEGVAAKVAFQPKPAIDGIQLKLAAASADATQLNTVFGWKKWIPAIGPVKANATISGNDRKLEIENMKVTAGRDNILLVEANGRVGKLSAVSNWRPRDADISIRVASTHSSALANRLGYRFPELGPLSGHARIHDKDKTLAIEPASLWIGDSAAPALQFTGSVGDLFAGRHIKAELTLDIDSHHLATYAGNQKLRGLNPLQGRLILSDDDGTLGIDSLHIESTHPQLLNLRVDGQFSDFENPATLSLNSRLATDDMQLVAALFGQEWQAGAPLQFDGQIRKAANGLDITGALTAGKLAVDANLITDLTASPPRIDGEITAQNFFFPDVLQKKTGKQKEDPAKGPVFTSAPIDFSYLGKANLDVSVDIRSFDKDRSRIESAKFKIALKSGDLSISSAQLVFPRGKIDFDAELATGDKPRFHFKAYGENLNPWLTLDMDESDSRAKFDADADVDLELSASGASEHELASSLEGNIYITIKNGRMRRSLLELVFVDLIGWTASKATGEKYEPVNCGVVDYSVRQGVVSTNAFFIDTDRIMITGDGRIDLGREQVDYVFLPRKKSRLTLKAEPVNVNGPLRAPAIRVIPWKSAAVTYGSLFFAPYVFVGVRAGEFLFGKSKANTEESPCLKYEKKRDPKKERPDPPTVRDAGRRR